MKITEQEFDRKIKSGLSYRVQTFSGGMSGKFHIQKSESGLNFLFDEEIWSITGIDYLYVKEGIAYFRSFPIGLLSREIASFVFDEAISENKEIEVKIIKNPEQLSIF